jgi:hypothetical protein
VKSAHIKTGWKETNVLKTKKKQSLHKDLKEDLEKENDIELPEANCWRLESRRKP